MRNGRITHAAVIVEVRRVPPTRRLPRPDHIFALSVKTADRASPGVAQPLLRMRV